MSELLAPPAPAADEMAQSTAELHRQLDELHEMIYRRGGVRPVNAAIEELSKLILLELKLMEDPKFQVPGRGSLDRLLDPDSIAAVTDVSGLKEAFRCVASLPEYAGDVPGGGRQAIWPHDEPLRISRPDVIAAAIRILRPQLTAAARNRFDVIGTAFDVFLRGRYDHSGGLGTHLTPQTVATALARICLTDLDLFAAPTSRPIIGDPCCGTGRFLIAALNELGVDRDDPRRLAVADRGLFGADQSASSVAKARINLLLLGIRRPQVFAVDDSIVDPHVDTLRGRLRLILTNPPFGDGKYDFGAGIERAAALLPSLRARRRIDPALAFVVRCVELLQHGGRLGIVLPDGLVDGPALRRAFLGAESVRLRDVSVEANVSLPKATFALAGTVARTSALVIRKQAADRGQIFLARAEHVGHLKQGSLSVPDPEGDDLPAIAAAARRVLAGELHASDASVRFLSRAPLAAVIPAQGATTLDPGRIDPDAVKARSALRRSGISFRDLLHPTRRRRREARAPVPFVSVLHIDDLGSVAWHEARAHRPSTPGLEARPRDLIVSLLNPRKLRATVIPDAVGPVLCSSEFGVFEPSGDPYEVLLLLHHPLVKSQLAPLGRGTSSSRRRISYDDLLDLLAPRLAPEELALRASRLKTALETLRSAAADVVDSYAMPNAPKPAVSVPSV